MTNFLLVLFTAALVVLAYTQVRFFARKERAFVFPDPVNLSIVNAPDDMVRVAFRCGLEEHRENSNQPDALPHHL